MYHIHYTSDTEYEIIPVTDLSVDEDGFITFTTDKLSYFVFVGKDRSSLNLITFILLILLFLLVVVYLSGYFLLYRPGKLDDKAIKIIYIFLPKKDGKKDENNKE